MNKSTEKKQQTVYAFIDGQNLILGTRSSGWILDYGKFRLYLRNKYHVQKAFLFIGYIKDNTNLYRYLQQCGYILIFKNVLEIKKRGVNAYKGNVDAELVLHTMIELDNYEKAIIITGDGDFFCLVEYLEKQKKLKKVITPNKKFSSLLRKYGKYIFNLELARDKLKKKQ